MNVHDTCPAPFFVNELPFHSETRILSSHIRLSLVKLGLLAWRLAEDRDPQSILAKDASDLDGLSMLLCTTAGLEGSYKSKR